MSHHLVEDIGRLRRLLYQPLDGGNDPFSRPVTLQDVWAAAERLDPQHDADWLSTIPVCTGKMFRRS